MNKFEDLVDKATLKLLDYRGFNYADDPMELGQNAYDITQQTKEEVRVVLKAILTTSLKESWGILE